MNPWSITYSAITAVLGIALIVWSVLNPGPDLLVSFTGGWILGWHGVSLFNELTGRAP